MLGHPVADSGGSFCPANPLHVHGCWFTAARRTTVFKVVGVRYTNDVLKSSFALVRQKFSIWVDHEDLRCVRAFLPATRRAENEKDRSTLLR